MIAIHADGLPVISDSEAFSYLGQNVKVAGLVFAVLISRLGTAFIVKESLTLVARKTIRLLMAALSLILTTIHSHAGLGWTLAQFEQQYGKPALDQEQIGGRIGYVFSGEERLSNRANSANSASFSAMIPRIAIGSSLNRAGINRCVSIWRTREVLGRAFTQPCTRESRSGRTFCMAGIPPFFM
jgi:hypothetical protein